MQLDPRYKSTIVTDMMEDKADGIITAIKKVFQD
jgi:hypothetical protein